MRVNVNEAPRIARRCRAWLDGVEVTNHCFEADTGLGRVGLYRTDEQARVIRDPDINGPVEEWRYGVVELEFDGARFASEPAPDQITS